MKTIYLLSLFCIALNFTHYTSCSVSATQSNMPSISLPALLVGTMAFNYFGNRCADKRYETTNSLSYVKTKKPTDARCFPCELDSRRMKRKKSAVLQIARDCDACKSTQDTYQKANGREETKLKFQKACWYAGEKLCYVSIGGLFGAYLVQTFKK